MADDAGNCMLIEDNMTDMYNDIKSKLPKILCLHGYRQNGDVFKHKLGALRKALKKHAKLFFVTAPNKLPSAEDSSLCSEDVQKSAFGTDMMFDSKKQSDVCLGFENSLALIEETFEKQGPFDGLLGFSQGAAFVGILCGMQETNWLKYEFNFAIMVAGFKSLCHPHLNYYFKQSSVPSLHVYGTNDKVISREMSELLMEHFVHTEIIEHPGGHFVPASGPQRQGYISFLEERKCEVESEEKRKRLTVKAEPWPDLWGLESESGKALGTAMAPPLLLLVPRPLPDSDSIPHWSGQGSALAVKSPVTQTISIHAAYSSPR
ncbi:esterase OVCA2 [Zootermopsis nevadensis]|uniref:esterase OVCA2 n=1 Tax=Zootermopsis nevadensis TaxID=136037 RepID=UPI000B8EB9CC|nr:esterase OVCA2 [Zootermopsis nevadensis]